MQTCKIEIATVEDIDGARFDGNLIENIDLVDLSVGNDNYCGNAAPQIQKGMKLDGTFVLSKDGPGEKR